MKVIDASEVGKLIKDGDMVAVSGSGGSGSAESVIRAIRDSFISTGHPKDIGVTCGISPGNLTEDEVKEITGLKSKDIKNIKNDLNDQE